MYRAKAQTATETVVEDVTPAATVVETIRPAGSPSDFDEEVWAEAVWLPCRLSVELAVPNFTIGDLLRLQPNNLLDSMWKQSADVPLRINGLLIGYAEFELLGEKTAVRLTELL
jgi:flagellar motor switch/type III secretory pathway protein FliN